MAEPTQEAYGHPWSGTNSRGHSVCRICGEVARARYLAKLKAEQ